MSDTDTVEDTELDTVEDTELEESDVHAEDEQPEQPEDGDDSQPFRELRQAHRDLVRQVRDLEHRNEQLAAQAEQAAQVRAPAVEYLGTKAGLSPARAKALARLHDGPVDDTAVAETITRYGLDKAVGKQGDDE